MINQQTPAEWLESQLKRRGWNRSEFARRAGIARSAVSRFARGECGCGTAIDIANGLDVPATVTLSLIGFVPSPPSFNSVEMETLATIYRRLDDGRREMLMSYAEHLRTLQRREL